MVTIFINRNGQTEQVKSLDRVWLNPASSTYLWVDLAAPSIPELLILSDTFTFHPQTVDKPNELVRRIRAAGMRPGVALDPDTPFEDVRRLMGAVDQVTVMTASADHEGQGFRAELLERVRLAREERDRKGLDLMVAADGLLALDNLTAVKAAGADVFVVGSGIFATEDPSRAFATVRAALRDLSPGETEDGVTRQVPSPGPAPITFLKRRATGR